MSFLTFLFRLRSIGIVLAKAGELLMRIGSSPSLTEIVRDERAADPDRQEMSQDSLSPQGAKDEEPEADGTGNQTEQGDLFETIKPV